MHIKYRHPFMQQGGASISWEEHSEQGGKYIVKLQLNKLKLAQVKQPTLKLQKAKSRPQQLVKSKLDLCEFNCLESPATSESVSLIWEIAEPSLGSLWRGEHLAIPQSIRCEHRMQLG